GRAAPGKGLRLSHDGRSSPGHAHWDMIGETTVSAHQASRVGAETGPWLALVVGIVAIVALIALPYLPGDHDVLAVPLSAMMQLFGYTGLLLVAFGVVWAAAGARSGRRSQARSA